MSHLSAPTRAITVVQASADVIGMTAHGTKLPTSALQQFVGYPRHSGSSLSVPLTASRVMAAWRPIGRRKCLADIFCSANQALPRTWAPQPTKNRDFGGPAPIPSHPLRKIALDALPIIAPHVRQPSGLGAAVTPAGIALSQAERWDSIPSTGYTYNGKLLAA
jgi:hypothetical protein